MTRFAAALLTAATFGVASGAPQQSRLRPCAITVRGSAVVDDLSSCEVLVGPEGANHGWSLELSAYRHDGSAGAGVHVGFPARPVVGERYGFDTQPRGIVAGTVERFIVPNSETGLKLLPVATHRAELRGGHSAGSTLSVVFSTVPSEGRDGRGHAEVHGTLEATIVAQDGAGEPITIRGTF